MGKKLTVYLIDGTDYGPKTIEIGNWSGKSIYSPRATLKDMIKRSEFDNPGVYILKSDPNDDIYSERIYIGEAECIGKRLKQHLQDTNRDFSDCIIFISKDEMLTKSHIKYLESRLIELSFCSKNAENENKNQPSKPTLSEADISDMEEFLRQINIILPIAGFSFLSRKLDSFVDKDNELKRSNIFYIKSKKIKASMVIENDAFKVLKGSEANVETSPSYSSGWKKLRDKLIDNKTLVLNNDKDKYIFADNNFFSSISAASSIVLGRQSSGPLEWIDKDGQSYKDYESM